MKIHFHMVNGQIISINSPPDLNFATFCLAIRAAGYFFVDNLYIDHFKINAIACGEQTVDIKQANAPGSQAVQ